MKLLAQNIEDVIGKIQPPSSIAGLTDKGGAAGISIFLGQLVKLAFVAAGLIFLFMVIFSALQWILSGGEKDKVEGARKRLTYAIIGLVVLSLAFVVTKLIGEITNFKIFP